MRQTDLSHELDKSFLLGLDEIREPKINDDSLFPN